MTASLYETGRYFVRDTEHRTPAISYDRDLQQRVWAASRACTVLDRTP